MKNITEILNEEIVFESAPQELCLKCGKCCTAITSSYTNAAIVEMAENNEEEAKIFVNTFKPYQSIDEARLANPEQVDKVLLKFIKNKKLDENEVTFYYCPHLTEENLCAVHSQRPDCCRRAPNNAWSLFPDGCGYEGWLFAQREKHKKIVRKLKEILYEIEMMEKASDNNVNSSNSEVKGKIINKIKSYEQYGSQNW